jgi:hypothetical protein
MAPANARPRDPADQAERTPANEAERTATNAARSLSAALGMARTRNGRPELDWFSRAQVPRWRMLRLNGTWYGRDALRRHLDRRGGEPRVPVTRRVLTPREVAEVMDPNPWTLGPRSR